MIEHLIGVRSVIWPMADHSFKYVLEELGCRHLAINLPEILLALEGELLVVWVIGQGSSEWLIFHP